MPLPTKRPRLTSADDQDPHRLLLPGLPDHLAQVCLSLLPPSLLFSVCRSWRRLIYSPSFPPFLSLYALLSSTSDHEDDPIGLYCFDPISNSWSHLPPPPPSPPLQIRHPSFLSRSLPIQSVSAAGHLVLLAASTLNLLPALPRPLAFHPASRRWILGPLLRSPRRWCAAGSASGNVYIASGVGSSYRSDVARSADRWDLSAASTTWEPIAPLRDGRFSREPVNAVAVGRKLCMVNVQGRVKEGIVYDIERDLWMDMPPGMVKGWTGPVAVGEGEGDMYVVDEVSGEVRAYDWGEDRWRVVAEGAEERRGAVVAAVGGGKICVATAGGGAVEVVDVAGPGKTWSVELPKGRRVVALHVLPRMRGEKLCPSDF